MMLMRPFPGDPGEFMRKRYIVSLVIVAMLVVLAGCTRNPDAAKRKYVESGMKYMTDKKYGSAVIQFKKALQIDPRYSEAHYELGQAELAQQHWAAAFREFSQAIEHDPNNIEGYLLLGNVLLGQKKPQEAIDVYTKAVALKPNDPGPYLNRAVAYNSLKQAAAAEDDLHKAISVDPKAMQAYYALSNFYMNQGEPKKAEEVARLAIQNASPEDPLPYLRLAGLMLQQGRKADGEQVV